MADQCEQHKAMFESHRKLNISSWVPSIYINPPKDHLLRVIFDQWTCKVGLRFECVASWLDNRFTTLKIHPRIPRNMLPNDASLLCH